MLYLPVSASQVMLTGDLDIKAHENEMIFSRSSSVCAVTEFPRTPTARMEPFPAAILLAFISATAIEAAPNPASFDYSGDYFCDQEWVRYKCMYDCGKAGLCTPWVVEKCTMCDFAPSTSLPQIVKSQNPMSEIVPDVVSMAPPPSFSVYYITMNNNRYSEAYVNAGNTLEVSQAKSRPTINFPKQQDQLYTIAMVDPDAPNGRKPSSENQYFHWLIINVRGSSLLSSGQTLVEYHGPSPPRGTGPHRYVFLAYQQQGRISTSSLNCRQECYYNIAKFAKENNMGDPIAGNYFFAEN